MNLDSTIQLGQLLAGAVEGVVFIVSALGVIFTVRADNKHIKSELADMKTELAKMVEVMVQLGRQDERIKVLERLYKDA